MNQIIDILNEKQKEAALTIDGPLLILAGAGSGKTRVLVNRAAYLIHECNVAPWNILAITFTNKAAGEMKERIDDIVGDYSESIWVATFHATCVRILRRYIDRLGYDTNFTIYDADDSQTVMKEVCKRLNMDPKYNPPRAMLAAVSRAKDELMGPKEFLAEEPWDFNRQQVAKAYAEYEKTLQKNNALDFDDLLLKTVELFKTREDVLESYQDRFRYIMVDEYQDTNTVQFELIRLLAGKHRNICVVGDDDQSIYRFRGANIRNILDFEKVYPDAKVVKLEQNYRSTQTILDAANSVIRQNASRKDKALWTDKGDGSKIRFRQFENAYEEAEFIAEDIASKRRRGEAAYSDCAVLYRTNAQSRLLEEKMIYAGIPYDVVGGVNFYSRREIKDLLAYLKTIDNAKDDLAVRRIINIPKRGIGATTITRIPDYALQRDISFFDALLVADEIPVV
ncbi:MAG: UvrD-helicase domain-containing protein, partial [Lachnospiraceae bacterium]|nr:UvrD-helicase domain-containing protein [Lachnospiraceae bacterium]